MSMRSLPAFHKTQASAAHHIGSQRANCVSSDVT